MRRLLLVLFATTVMASLSVGSATSLRVSSENLTSGVFEDWGVSNDSAVVLVCSVEDVGFAFESPLGDRTLVDAVTVTEIEAGCENAAVHIEVTRADGSVTRARGVLGPNVVQVFPLDHSVDRDSVVSASAALVP